MKMRVRGSNVRKNHSNCSQSCEKGFVGEEMEGGKGDTTANKAVGQNGVQLLPRC